MIAARHALCLLLSFPGFAAGQTPGHAPGQAPEQATARDLPGAMDIAPQPPQPGPPIIGFPRNIGQCWVLSALPPEAQRIGVTLGMTRGEDGRPLQDTIRLLSATDGEAAAVEQAFQFARRAILRCAQADPDLRPLTAADPRSVEITFDPSGPSDR